MRGSASDKNSFVCAADSSTKDIVLLRSYNVPDESNIHATICQAAIATSATTTFFDPVAISDRTFADGGLGANNPVFQVAGEALSIWGSDTGTLKPLVKCFISIGTGNFGKEVSDGNIENFIGQTIVQIAMETENTEKKFIARCAKHLDDKRYFRFNIEQGLQDIGLDEYKNKGAVEAVAEGYMTHRGQKFRAQDCIENLRLKRSM